MQYYYSYNQIYFLPEVSHKAINLLIIYGKVVVMIWGERSSAGVGPL